MSEPKPVAHPRRRRCARAALLGGWLLLAGCASAPRRHGDLVPSAAAVPGQLEAASPAARDALAAGLRWIAADAAETTTGKRSPQPAPGEERR